MAAIFRISKIVHSQEQLNETKDIEPVPFLLFHGCYNSFISFNKQAKGTVRAYSKDTSG